MIFHHYDNFNHFDRFYGFQIPNFTQEQMLRWWKNPKHKSRTVRHMYVLADMNIQVMRERCQCVGVCGRCYA